MPTPLGTSGESTHTSSSRALRFLTGGPGVSLLSICVCSVAALASGIWRAPRTGHCLLTGEMPGGAPTFSSAWLSGSGPGSPLPEASGHVHTQGQPSAGGSHRCPLCRPRAAGCRGAWRSWARVPRGRGGGVDGPRLPETLLAPGPCEEPPRPWDGFVLPWDPWTV